MGKKNKKRRQQQQHEHGENHPKKKRRKHGGYWINTCRESQPKEGEETLMTIFISQSDLVDNHKLVPREDKGEMSLVTKSKTSKEDREDVIAEEETKETNVSKDAASPTADATKAERKQQMSQKENDYDHAFVSVKRMPSATKPQKKYEDDNFEHLPNGDCGDGIVNPYPKDVVADKYWAQRRRLFSRFDEGIELDRDGWFSVTPEAIAHHIAKRVVEGVPQPSGKGLVVLDAFCGCGGNVIAFAQRPEVSLVVCIDTDLSRLQMAAKNASIYGIETSKLLFVHDNAVRILALYSDGALIDDVQSASGDLKSTSLHGYIFSSILPKRIDCIFLSPPWGGSEYEQIGKGNFQVKRILVRDSEDKSMNGQELLQMAAKAVKPIALFLPRNLNGIAMGRSALQAGYTGSIELEKNVLNDKLKTITAYLGFNESDSMTDEQPQGKIDS